MTTAGPWSCPSCASAGRAGYCAPHRCYCGHPACHAFGSYIGRLEQARQERAGNVVRLPGKPMVPFPT